MRCRLVAGEMMRGPRVGDQIEKEREGERAWGYVAGEGLKSFFLL